MSKFTELIAFVMIRELYATCMVIFNSTRHNAWLNKQQEMTQNAFESHIWSFCSLLI